MDIKDYISTSITIDKERLKRYKKRVNSSAEGVLKCKRHGRTGKKEYYLKLPNQSKYHYVCKKDYKKIQVIKRREIAKECIKVLQHNIKCKETFLMSLWNDSLEEITGRLPLVYQPDADILEKVENRRSSVKQSENPFQREHLTLETSFGLFVRSKGELAIAELLYSLGITFYYEKALVLTVQRYDEVGVPYTVDKTYYPDFTIVLSGGRTIYWEHKGLLKKMDYVERDFYKEIDYNKNGIYQSHNLIVTSEGPNNQIDMEGIKRIVTGWLMPIMNL